MASTTLTSKGQLTLPKSIREFLRVKAGDPVDFLIDDEGRVIVRPATVDVRSLKGLLRRSGRRAVKVEDMDAAIARFHRKQR
jgi:AbrB family looped-hinge helix DNA binding protein